MRHGPKPPALHKHIHQRADDGHKIHRQQQQRPQQRPRPQPRQRLAHHLPQPRDRITASFPSAGGGDVAPLRDERLAPAGHQRAVKGIRQGVAEDERAREEGGDGGAFAEDEQGGREGGQQGPAREEHQGHLRDVGEEEHARCDAEAEGDGLAGAREERAPEGFVGCKVDEALGSVISLSLGCGWG